MKRRLFKRLCVFAMIACFGIASMSTTNVFASEVINKKTTIEIVEDEAITTYAEGNLLYSSSATIKNSATVTITTAEGNVNANFYVGVLGNTGKTYTVNMYVNGKLRNEIAMVVGGGEFINIANLLYAGAGTYKFTFTCYENVSTSGTAMVWIYD